MAPPSLGHGLDAPSCTAFWRDGFLCPVDVMGEDEARLMRQRIEVIEGRSHGRLSGLVRLKPHLLVPLLWDLVHDARIVDAVSSLLGADIYCLGSSLIDKPPGSGGHVAWHQDATFWGLDRCEGVTAWLALTPATRESGCMEAIPQTHFLQLPHCDTRDPNNMLGAREAVASDVDSSSAAVLSLALGQMSLHHPLVLHGSGRNTSHERRLGFAIRYVPADVRQDGGTVTLVRGSNRANMHLEVAPEAELDPRALARHADIIRRAGGVIRRAKLVHMSGQEPKGATHDG